MKRWYVCLCKQSINWNKLNECLLAIYVLDKFMDGNVYFFKTIYFNWFKLDHAPVEWCVYVHGCMKSRATFLSGNDDEDDDDDDHKRHIIHFTLNSHNALGLMFSSLLMWNAKKKNLRTK